MPSLNHLFILSINALFSLLLFLSTHALAVRQLTVSNKCPSPIYVAVGGKGGALTTIGGVAQPGGGSRLLEIIGIMEGYGREQGVR
ncbi:hypothetical protein I314_02704 [Cryptococcus bacillisporus CA1873]|uniref:Uncharacterized protein n=1 Tax=Cryptococcus bacillisporus CA1873 TaxID=1296111 RepID=A0ABR5BC72_CRYGA|nr:hypothetical protein I314_02704 [Cryptococcus bacillisporus CA1873]|eukprot:KIR63923.1 hypothetical protein I314_02704 [Cryptococcus gattii CA1873]